MLLHDSIQHIYVACVGDCDSFFYVYVRSLLTHKTKRTNERTNEQQQKQKDVEKQTRHRKESLTVAEWARAHACVRIVHANVIFRISWWNLSITCRRKTNKSKSATNIRHQHAFNIHCVQWRLVGAWQQLVGDRIFLLSSNLCMNEAAAPAIKWSLLAWCIYALSQSPEIEHQTKRCRRTHFSRVKMKESDSGKTEYIGAITTTKWNN